MAGPTIALAPALAIAGEQGVGAAIAATLLGAMRDGIASTRRANEDNAAA